LQDDHTFFIETFYQSVQNPTVRNISFGLKDFKMVCSSNNLK